MDEARRRQPSSVSHMDDKHLNFSCRHGFYTNEKKIVFEGEDDPTLSPRTILRNWDKFQKELMDDLNAKKLIARLEYENTMYNWEAHAHRLQRKELEIEVEQLKAELGISDDDPILRDDFDEYSYNTINDVIAYDMIQYSEGQVNTMIRMSQVNLRKYPSTPILNSTEYTLSSVPKSRSDMSRLQERNLHRNDAACRFNIPSEEEDQFFYLKSDTPVDKSKLSVIKAKLSGLFQKNPKKAEKRKPKRLSRQQPLCVTDDRSHV